MPPILNWHLVAETEEKAAYAKEAVPKCDEPYDSKRNYDVEEIEDLEAAIGNLKAKADARDSGKGSSSRSNSDGREGGTCDRSSEGGHSARSNREEMECGQKMYVYDSFRPTEVRAGWCEGVQHRVIACCVFPVPAVALALG